MLKKTVMIFLVLILMGASKFSFAACSCCGKNSAVGKNMQLAQADKGNMQMNKETVVPVATAESAKNAEDVGNKICPVSGEKIDEKTKATYEYQGKIYNFCCPMCIDEFKKDPEKYIKKIEGEKQKEATESTEKEKDMQMPMEHHEQGK